MQENPPPGGIIGQPPQPQPTLPPEEPTIQADPSGPGFDWDKFKSIASTVVLFLLAPLIALGITTYMFQSYEVDGESMETTLQNHDRLIVNKIPRTVSRLSKDPYIPQRGDIIIFDQFGLFDASGRAERQLIKRVVGLPGDHVVIKGGSVTIYNAKHPTGYNPDENENYTIAATTTSGDINVTIKPGQIYVLGDNRGNSADSRIFGPIESNQIVGKLAYRILPISKAQKY